MELFGLKDSDGKEYKLTLLEENNNTNLFVKKIELIEPEPEFKELPMTITELTRLLYDFREFNKEEHTIRQFIIKQNYRSFHPYIYKKGTASEITSHVMEFIEWFTGEKSPVAILYGNQKERFATTDKDYTIEELYQYWINNVKTA